MDWVVHIDYLHTGETKEPTGSLSAHEAGGREDPQRTADLWSEGQAEEAGL